MANLTDTATSWEAGIYQIETTDPVVGGAPNPSTGAGMSNIPHLQLAKRTQFLYGKVGNYLEAETISAGFTATAAGAGKCWIYGGTTAITITLPAISATPTGAVYEFVNTGTADMTIQRAGSDQIDSGPTSVSSMVIPPNQSLRLIRSNGSSLWHPVGITAAGLSQVMAASLSANGWQRLPSGLIMQWGARSYGDFAAVQTLATTFPIAFPTAALSFVGTADTSQASINVTQANLTATGVNIVIREDDTTSAAGVVRWIAVGY